MKKKGHNIKIYVLLQRQESLHKDIELFGDGDCPECHKPRVRNHLAERYDFQGYMAPDVRLAPVQICVAS